MPVQLDTAAVTVLLRARPALDKYALVSELGTDAAGLTTHDLNAFLYRHSDLFEWRPGARSARLWYIRGVAPQEPAAPAATTMATPLALLPASPLSPYPWQQRALDAWHRNGSVGVVEAVTGAGKTRVALRAIADECQTAAAR